MGEHRPERFVLQSAHELNSPADFGLASYQEVTHIPVGLMGYEYEKGQSFIGYNTQIENLIGTAFNDHLTGNNADNNIYGGEGADSMTGGLGDDVFVLDNQVIKSWKTPMKARIAYTAILITSCLKMWNTLFY